MIRAVLHIAFRFVEALGIDPPKMLRAICSLPSYLQDLIVIRRQARNSTHPFVFRGLFPCLHDRYNEGGIAKGQYFHQDLFVARRLFINGATIHYDVGSRIDGFVAHVAVYRRINVVDIRPISSQVQNITFIQADISATIPDRLVNCCDSLSCLHALEHFGLGRYGDPVDHDGYLRGLNNLHLMLQKGGRFYLSLPIGSQRIEFNGHRFFNISYLLLLFESRFRIEHFSYIDDLGDFYENVPLKPEKVSCNYGCMGGCGIFELVKL